MSVPDRLSGACFGGSKSPNLASNHGIAFRQARDQAHGTPQILFFSLCALLLCTSICYKDHTSPQALHTLTQPRYNSSRASSFSLCDRHQPCFCLCLCVCHPRILPQAVGTMNTEWGSISASLFLLCCLLLLYMHHPANSKLCTIPCDSHGVCHPDYNLDDCNPHFLWFSKAPVQYTDIPTATTQLAATLI